MTIPLIILGTGGSAHDVLDIVEASNAVRPRWEPVRVPRRRPRGRARSTRAWRSSGASTTRAGSVIARFINAIGSDRSYRRRAALVARTGLAPDLFATLVHPGASVSSRARLGRGVGGELRRLGRRRGADRGPRRCSAPAASSGTTLGSARTRSSPRARSSAASPGSRKVDTSARGPSSGRGSGRPGWPWSGWGPWSSATSRRGRSSSATPPVQAHDRPQPCRRNAMTPIVTVENLSKRYRVGARKAARYRTLRESLTTAAASPWEAPGAPLRGVPAPDRSGEEDFWALRRRLVRGPAGRGRRDHRPQRGGQDHAAEDPAPDHRADRRAGARSAAGSAACWRSAPGSTRS